MFFFQLPFVCCISFAFTSKIEASNDITGICARGTSLGSNRPYDVIRPRSPGGKKYYRNMMRNSSFETLFSPNNEVVL